MKKLLMISGDRSILRGKKGAFWYTLEEMKKHWERIDVLCPHPGQNEQLKIENGEFKNVFFHPSPRGLWYQPFWIRKKGKELIAAHGHDVMTVHEYPPFYNGIGALFLRRIASIPAAIEVHHIVGYPVSASFFETIGRVLSRLFLPFEARHVDAVRVVNTEVKSILASWGAPPKKIHVVSSMYLDHTLLQPSGEEKTYDISFCARLVKNKGLDRLLHALALLPNKTLMVIGDGPERANMERLASSLGVADRVTFAGWQPDQNAMVRLVQSARVFVMCSLSEGGPRTALEAMACGMPVVVTRVGMMPELIRDGENGCFTTGTPDDLSAVIGRLLGDEGLRLRMGTNARAVLDQFDRTNTIKAYADFLSNLSS